MRELFNSWLNKRRENLRKNEERKEKIYKDAQESIECAKKTMLESYCPLNNENCESECVHFENGYLTYESGIGGNLVVVPIYPKCKLWGE